MNHLTLMAAALAVSLSACTTMPVPANVGLPAPAAITCDASPATWAVGRHATAEIVERVRVDSHSGIVRTLRPGQMITMDIRAERVDIRVDATNVILAVNCG